MMLEYHSLHQKQRSRKYSILNINQLSFIGQWFITVQSGISYWAVYLHPLSKLTGCVGIFSNLGRLFAVSG